MLVTHQMKKSVQPLIKLQNIKDEIGNQKISSNVLIISLNVNQSFVVHYKVIYAEEEKEKGEAEENDENKYDGQSV